MEHDEQRSFDRDSEREEMHQEDDKQFEINANIELPPRNWATRAMDWIVWGNPNHTPITPENIDLSPSDEVWAHKPSNANDEPF